MKAILLSAGQGTRLKKLTESRPKPMLPVNGRPLLEILVEWLRESGVRDIAINLHYCPHAITEHFGDGTQNGVSITYSYENELLGTAGAAKQLEYYLDQRFVVAYGDVLTNIDLSRLVAGHTARLYGSDLPPAITMALYRVPDPTQCGVVDVDAQGLITRFVEKPASDEVFSDLAFAGIMICEPSVLDYIPAGAPFDFGHDLLPVLLNTGVSVRGMEILPDEFVIDIGTLQGYLRALRMFSNQPVNPPSSILSETAIGRSEPTP